MRQISLFKNNVSPKDIVYTPDYVAKDIISFFNPVGKCLDPCRGESAFYKYLPDGSEWCEIAQGRDFYDYDKAVDWIVGNPPYSIFADFLSHSFHISENVVYIVPTNKIFQSFKIMDQIEDFGGIKAILVYGCGKAIGFPFGFSVGAFHFSKGFQLNTKIVFRRITNRQT